MKTIYGVLIRKQREAEGLTLSELSERCLIKEKYLKEAEKGEPVLSHADLVLVCNALDISSVALVEGRLQKKPGVPELEELILKLERKMDELQESILEMKEAAAALKGMAPEKAREKGTVMEDPEEVPEKSTVPEASEKTPDAGIIRSVPEKMEPLGPVI